MTSITDAINRLLARLPQIRPESEAARASPEALWKPRDDSRIPGGGHWPCRQHESVSGSLGPRLVCPGSAAGCWLRFASGVPTPLLACRQPGVGAKRRVGMRDLRYVPQSHGAVAVGGGEQLAVRTERQLVHASYSAGGEREPDGVAGSGVPQPDGATGVGAGQQLAG
jgi:hypothetical protein